MKTWVVFIVIALFISKSNSLRQASTRIKTCVPKRVIVARSVETSTALLASPDDDAGLSLKTLAIIVVGSLGVFGTGLLGTLQGIGKEIAFEQKAQQQGYL